MRRTHHLIILFSFLFILFFLCGCESLENGVMAVELDETPEEFVIISEEQMDNFPHLKEAISLGKIVTTPLDEYKEIYNLLEDIRNIQYMDKFYKIMFVE